METFVLVTSQSWHDDLFKRLCKRVDEKWIRIKNKEDFNYDILSDLNPSKVFIPHWSQMIPSQIFDNFECIVFHMTDLPYGRGGSPLQNLIIRGHQKTKISAIRVREGIDTGEVYLKYPLSLNGTAKEIFDSSAVIIETMIQIIMEQSLQPVPQAGEVTIFKRRKAEDSNMQYLTSLESLYNHIRMLDCEGYPPAFFDIGPFRLTFTQGSLKEQEKLTAHVIITRK